MASCAEAQSFVSSVYQTTPPAAPKGTKSTTIIDGKQVNFDFDYLTNLSQQGSPDILDGSEFEDHTLTVALNRRKVTQALFSPVVYEYERGSRASKRVLAFNAPLIAKFRGRYDVIEQSGVAR